MAAVLVMGAAGGLGSAGGQVGKYLGAKVIGAAGADSRVQAAVDIGADAGVNYRTQDLTAEVFQQALANLGRFEWRGVPFAAWLYRIAANAVTDHHQRIVRDQNVPPDLDLWRQEHEGAERCASLYRAVRELPADQRRVIEMRFAEDRSIAEIARVLGRSEGAVKQLQFRAFGSLRARLDRDDV